MPGLQTVLELLFLWGAAAAACGLVYLAVRARRIEREHGLFRSKHRVTASVVACALVILVAAIGTRSAFRGTIPPERVARGQADAGAKSGPAAETGPTPEELAVLEKERKELEEKLAKLRKQIEAAKRPAAGDRRDDNSAAAKSDAPDGTPAPAEFEVPTPLLVAAGILVIGGVILLLLLGDPEVLVQFLLSGGRRNRGELRLRALASLDQLTAAAERGDFANGLLLADATNPHALDRFERMDWVFLRAYCAVQHALSGIPDADRKVRLDEAVRGLTTLLEEAPNHGEAAYLLAVAVGFTGTSAVALERFTQAETVLGVSDLPFAHNKSVCLLRLAEEKLGEGNADESGRLFDQVTELKVLADRIPTTLVRVRLLSVRRALQAGRPGEAAEGIAVVRKLEGLDAEQKQNVDVVCDALQALVSIRQGDDALVLQNIDGFLAKHIPSGLPAADEGVADEYLEPPFTGIELRVEPQVFGAFLFLKAAVLARVATKAGRPPSVAQRADIIRALLTALQFELRQRDVLAALGGVYYWFVPEKRRKALDWLEAAVAMGVESRVARRILDRDRRIEAENREALEWFRSAAGRFLHDPSVSAHVRQALVEELGRFQGFQPLLLELDRQTDLEPQEPTVRLLRERAGYMQQVVSDFAARKPAAVQAEFDELRQEYARLLTTLGTSSGRMAEIEQRLVQEIGKTVLS